MTAPLAIAGRRLDRSPLWLLTLLAGAVVVWIGRVGPDWPAQEFRAWLARDVGLQAWNDSWYSGHALPGYSVLYPPVAAVLGAALTGLLAVTACALAVAKLPWPTVPSPARAGVVFLVGASASLCVLDNLIIGQVPFLLGLAAGLHSLLMLRANRPWVAGILAAGCSLSSPLAGLFLALAALAWLPDIGWRRARPLAGAGLGSAVAVVVGGGSGTFPSDIYSAAGVAAFTVLGAFLLPRELIMIRRFVLIYAAAAAVLLAVPNPVGGNVDRLGRLIAIPLAVWVLGYRGRGREQRSRLRRSMLATSLLAAMLWHFYPVVSAIARSSDDPSDSAPYYSGLLTFLSTRSPTQGRLEIPFTREHWEAAFVAPHFPIARGWERQLDLQYNDILYQPLTAATYRTWLDAAAVDLIALPTAPIDYGGVAERNLLTRPPAYLTLVYRDANWRVYQVAHPTPILTGAAVRLNSIGSASFTVQFLRPGTATIRLHASSLWQTSSPSACLEPNPDGWLHIRDTRPESVTVKASITVDGLLHRAGPYCTGG